ncbi:hypothetical protein STENM36S_08747 [Streptomyces tendae]
MLRAAVFVAVCVVLAAAGRTRASCAAVPLWSLGAGFLGAVLVVVPLAGRRRSLPGIVTLLALGQTALHALFGLGQHGTVATPVTASGGGAGALSDASLVQQAARLLRLPHCPDVCPLTMNNIAVAKKQLPQAEQDKLRVVFVSTDPERDTPAALGKWLKGIDPQIVGLTGEFDTIQAGARTLGISIDPPTKDKDGKIVSTHGTQVVAFSPKSDAGYVLYGEDATVDDYTKDLPKLIKGENP